MRCSEYKTNPLNAETLRMPWSFRFSGNFNNFLPKFSSLSAHFLQIFHTFFRALLTKIHCIPLKKFSDFQRNCWIRFNKLQLVYCSYFLRHKYFNLVPSYMKNSHFCKTCAEKRWKALKLCKKCAEFLAVHFFHSFSGFQHFSMHF